MPPPEGDAGAWLRGLRADLLTVADPDSLGPLQLAWLGDAVWELHQRLCHCRSPGRSDDLHRAVVGKVQAEAQSRALERLEPWLDAQECEWVRRGRNRAGRGPRRGDARTYGRATGFETMVGWLFLRNPERLAELLERLDASES